MKKTLVILTSLLTYATVKAQIKPIEQSLTLYTGSFMDDYAIRYSISDTLWLQLPRTRFHIIKWNVPQQYLIARNDEHNPGDASLYTRIDFIQFNNMEPWKWGYCLTAYNAKTDILAEATAAADRINPKKGCNGFPFSRMKKVP